jgi:site-specific recombinase XerD
MQRALLMTLYGTGMRRAEVSLLVCGFSEVFSELLNGK